MPRNLAWPGGVAQASGRSVSSIACLAFVAVLAGAFWAGAYWIAQSCVTMAAAG